MKIKNLNLSDILTIENLMDENNLIGNNVSVLIEISDKAALRKLNEDFYYRLNRSDKETDFDSDEFIVNVCGLRFIYRLAK